MSTMWFVQGVAGCSERNISPPRPVYLVCSQVAVFGEVHSLPHLRRGDRQQGSASFGLFDTEDMVEEGDVFKLWPLRL